MLKVGDKVTVIVQVEVASIVDTPKHTNLLGTQTYQATHWINVKPIYGHQLSKQVLRADAK